jgi:hypothetical protein
MHRFPGVPRVDNAVKRLRMPSRACRWRLPEPWFRRGCLARWASMTTRADTGAILKWN